MPNGPAVSKCEAYAAGNHGIVPRLDALSAGMSNQAISRLLKKGRWQRLYPSAYLVSGAPVTWQTRLAAVAANLQEGFAFSHRTAGSLLGLDAVPPNRLEVISKRCIVLSDVKAHRVARFPSQIIRVDGFPITSAHRTVMDLFSVLSVAAAERALEDALRKKLTSIDRLWAEYTINGKPGRNGCRAFRNTLLKRDHQDGTLQSRMEAKLRQILKDIPSPKAVPQFPVQTPSNRYFLDFAFPDIKLGIEAQSIKWHMGEAKFFRDLKRDRDLKRIGWTLIYYAWDDFLDPVTVANEIIEMRGSMMARFF